MHNNILSPLTLPVEVVRDKEGRPAFDLSALNTALAFTGVKHPLRPAWEWQPEAQDQAARSLELYLRRMLSRCALRIHVPYDSGHDTPRPQQLKPLLASTVKKAIRFVDRSDRYWNAVVAYLKPISRSLPEDQRVSTLAWRLYLLILATKYNSEVVLPPKATLILIQAIEASDGLSAEAKARLSVVAGLFRSFSKPVEGHTLRLLPNVPAFAVSERIAEILEDAYLLEASHLRRLLGVKENITSVKRDLRLLLSFIQRKRPWAKGLVGIGSDVILGGSSSFALAEKLLDLVPGFGSGTNCPILAVRDEGIMIEKESCFQFARSIKGNTLISLDGFFDHLSVEWEEPNKSLDASGGSAARN